MKNLKWLVLCLVVIGCSTKKSEQTQETKSIEEEANVAFIDPDNFFAEAIVDFEKGALSETQERIRDAKESIRKIIIEGDTVYSSIILEALNQLDTLDANLSSGKEISASSIRSVFAKVDWEIARYNVDVVEDWARHGSNNEESLQRMHRAMVRVEYALNHAQIELSEYDSIAVALAKRDLVQAEKVSSSLWESIKSNLEELNRKFDSGSNSMNND